MGDALNLPNSWVLVTVADLGKVISGGTPSTKENSYWGGNISWISPSDLTGYSHTYITRGAKCITQEGLKNSSATIMPAGSIHFSSRAPIGYTVISSCDMTTNQGFKSLVPVQGVFNEYVYYYFKSAKQLAESNATGTTFKEISGAAFSKLRVPLPPTNEQHRIVAKIDELFSELDKGIENLKTARTQLKVYRQALLKHAFEGKLTAQWRAEKKAVIPAKAGIQPLNDMDSRLRGNDEMRGGNDEVGSGNDKPLETAAALLKRIQQERAQRYQQQLADWQTNGGSKPKAPKPLPPLTAEELAELPVLPEGWGWEKLGNVADLIGGVTKGKDLEGKEKIFLPYLRVANVQDGYLDLTEIKNIEVAPQDKGKYRLEYGDVLYTEGGDKDKLGRGAVWHSQIENCIHQNHIFRARIFGGVISPEILSLYSQTKSAKRYFFRHAKQTTNLASINLTVLSNLPVAILPQREQKQIQMEIEARLSEVDQLEQTITTSLQQAEALRQSILKKAFSGQLVPQDPHDEPASNLLARIKAERATPPQPPFAKGGRSRSNKGVSEAEGMPT